MRSYRGELIGLPHRPSPVTRTLDPSDMDVWVKFCTAQNERAMAEYERQKANPMWWFTDQLGDV